MSEKRKSTLRRLSSAMPRHCRPTILRLSGGRLPRGNGGRLRRNDLICLFRQLCVAKRQMATLTPQHAEPKPCAMSSTYQ